MPPLYVNVGLSVGKLVELLPSVTKTLPAGPRVTLDPSSIAFPPAYVEKTSAPAGLSFEKNVSVRPPAKVDCAAFCERGEELFDLLRRERDAVVFQAQ